MKNRCFRPNANPEDRSREIRAEDVLPYHGDSIVPVFILGCQSYKQLRPKIFQTVIAGLQRASLTLGKGQKGRKVP